MLPDHSPWFVIPADHKWYRDAAVAGIVWKTLEQMAPQLPKVSVDLAEMRRLYEAAAGRQTKDNGPKDNGQAKDDQPTESAE